MSTVYNQLGIVGFDVKIEDLKVVDSPEKFQMVQKYNPNTGEKSHEVKDIIQWEKCHYELFGFSVDEVYDFEPCIKMEYRVECLTDRKNKRLVIGKSVAKISHQYNINLLDTEISLEELEKMKAEVLEKFPGQDVRLILWSDVG